MMEQEKNQHQLFENELMIEEEKEFAGDISSIMMQPENNL
jgi:hypothetical protein